MKTRLRLLVSVMAGCCIAPLFAFADDKVEGNVEAGVGTYFGGRRDSSKFEEYREVPGGLFGGGEIYWENDDGYHAEGGAADIAQDDQEYFLGGGKLGSFSAGIAYDEMPHRYAYSVRSLYREPGDSVLVLPDETQNRVSRSASLTEAANILDSEVQNNAVVTDLEVKRQKGSIAFKLEEFDPLYVTLEASQENRDGNRQFGTGFGFNNMTEIIEPRDWKTYQYKLNVEYATKPFYASLQYYGSIFKNDNDTLSWDNPFSTTDTTSPTAYLSPSAGAGGLVTTGPSHGLVDLVPDNYYHNVSALGVVRELPLNSQVQLQGSWGWMRQDDDILPFTTNTAITEPLNASSRASLPIQEANREVDTQLYNLTLTSHPLDYLDVKARYRYYEWDNGSWEVSFPGYVRFDASWIDAPIRTEPISYEKHTAALDFDFDVTEHHSVGLGYKYERMDREHREVDATDDNAFMVSYDNDAYDGVMIRASYEHAIRRIDGDYDPFAPFEGVEEVPVLPFLRKYDEADRDRDKVMLLATVTPLDTLAISGSFQYGYSDYTNSDFGLQEDEFFVYGLDADYAFTEQTKLFGFYSFEKHDSEQRDRQWNPGAAGDPFTREPGIASASNWTADLSDDVHTFGGGFDVGIIPEKVTFRLSASFSLASGEAELDSPVGSPASDANAFDPDDFTSVDDNKLYMVSPQVIVTMKENLKLVVGYLWEKMDITDYNRIGFDNVPTTTTGAYNGALLLGSLPGDYEVNWGFAKLIYSF